MVWYGPEPVALDDGQPGAVEPVALDDFALLVVSLSLVSLLVSFSSVQGRSQSTGLGRVAKVKDGADLPPYNRRRRGRSARRQGEGPGEGRGAGCA